MKSIFAAAAVIALGTASAGAADLAARPYTKAPAMVDPAYNWTGFYVGVNGGYGWNATSSTIDYMSTNGNGFAATGTNFSSKGGFGGVQGGYNWQKDRYVFGIEADIQGASIRSGINATIPSNAGPLGIIATQAVDYFGTVRGRVGVTFDHFLIYGTGGFAYGGVRDNFVTFNGAATAPLTSNTRTSTGYTAGGGVEYAFAPSWSVKGEYQYIDLGKQTSTGISTNGIPLQASNIDTKFHTVRVGLNYKLPIPTNY